MTVKCSLCDAEVPADPRWPGRPCAGVYTNYLGPDGEPKAEGFIVIYGVWNQRAKSMFYVCGACLAEREFALPPLTIPHGMVHMRGPGAGGC